jgi:hypothetical protein
MIREMDLILLSTTLPEYLGHQQTLYYASNRWNETYERVLLGGMTVLVMIITILSKT